MWQISNTYYNNIQSICLESENIQLDKMYWKDVWLIVRCTNNKYNWRAFLPVNVI